MEKPTRLREKGRRGLRRRRRPRATPPPLGPAYQRGLVVMRGLLQRAEAPRPNQAVAHVAAGSESLQRIVLGQITTGVGGQILDGQGDTYAKAAERLGHRARAAADARHGLVNVVAGQSLLARLRGGLLPLGASRGGTHLMGPNNGTMRGTSGRADPRTGSGRHA